MNTTLDQAYLIKLNLIDLFSADPKLKDRIADFISADIVTKFSLNHPLLSPDISDPSQVVDSLRSKDPQFDAKLQLFSFEYKLAFLNQLHKELFNKLVADNDLSKLTSKLKAKLANIQPNSLWPTIIEKVADATKI